MRAAGSLQRNRLNKARVVVLNVADARTDGPGEHLLRRVGREQALELARISGLLPEPSGQVSRLRTTGIRL
jgi:hypothetical protein